MNRDDSRTQTTAVAQCAALAVLMASPARSSIPANREDTSSSQEAEESGMKTSSSIRKCLLASAGLLLLMGFPALAAPGQAKPAGGMPGHDRGFDWMHHTRATLAELEGKLNMAAEQKPAWETWSGGVIKDAHEQLESKNDLHDAKEREPDSRAELTTPEQMSRGIERLHAEIDWMQQHLVQLEAAQVRTRAFYEILDTNQRTIFDLFWHEMYHRAAGHDDDRGDDEPGGHGPGRMMRDVDGPGSQH